MPSRQELDSQDATVKRAQADEASTNAQVAQSQASLSGIETDIRKAVIRSPDQRDRARSANRPRPDGGGVVPDAYALHAGGGPHEDAAHRRR